MKPELNTSLKEMKTAWYEWNVGGIKELRDKPGTYVFMRAILTDTESEESSESQDSRVSHQLPTVLNVGTPITDVGIPVTAKTVDTKLTTVLTPNPFYSLDPSSNTSRSWTQVASRSPRKPTQTQLQQSSADSVEQPDSRSVSVNLLDSASSVEPLGLPPEEDRKLTDLQSLVLQLQNNINDLKTWQNQTTPTLARASKNATRASIMLEKTDIAQLSNNIHTLKSSLV